MKKQSCKITEDMQLELYKMYNDKAISDEVFMMYCKKLIEESRVPNRQLLSTITRMKRDMVLLSTNNFIMKGHGYGVL